MQFGKEIRTAWRRIPGDNPKLIANDIAGRSLCEHALLGGLSAEGCLYSSVQFGVSVTNMELTCR